MGFLSFLALYEENSYRLGVLCERRKTWGDGWVNGDYQVVKARLNEVVVTQFAVCLILNYHHLAFLGGGSVLCNNSS